MSKKQKPKSDEAITDRDQAAFEELPKDTKHLMRLKDQEEKTTGPEQVEVTKKIEGKSANKKDT